MKTLKSPFEINWPLVQTYTIWRNLASLTLKNRIVCFQFYTNLATFVTALSIDSNSQNGPNYYLQNYPIICKKWDNRKMNSMYSKVKYHLWYQNVTFWQNPAKIQQFVKKLPFCACRPQNIWRIWSSSHQANQTDWNTGSYWWKTVYFLSHAEYLNRNTKRQCCLC